VAALVAELRGALKIELRRRGAHMNLLRVARSVYLSAPLSATISAAITTYLSAAISIR
jgi:hypothetical protein